jgi:hypothetical protein
MHSFGWLISTRAADVLFDDGIDPNIDANLQLHSSNTCIRLWVVRCTMWSGLQSLIG